jgi:hypothetical protein
VYLGYRAGYSSSGTSNILIGNNAGNNSSTEVAKNGSNNIMIGTSSGSAYYDAHDNVLLGGSSGFNLTTGAYNVCIGPQAGQALSGGSGNVFIGYQANMSTNTFNELYIQNSSSSPPLIWGGFTSREVKVFGNTLSCISSGTGNNTSIEIGRVNPEGRVAVAAVNSAWFVNTVPGDLCIRTESSTQKIHIGTNGSDIPVMTVMDDVNVGGRIGINNTVPAYPIQVGTNPYNGNGAYLTGGGAWTDGSSRSFKDRFNSLEPNDILDKISKLNIQSWYYKNTEEYHIGPVAEDFYDLFGTGDRKSLYVNKYLSPLDVAGVSLFAIKEIIRENDLQKSKIEKQNEVIDQLKSQNVLLMERLERIESQLFNK